MLGLATLFSFERRRSFKQAPIKYSFLFKWFHPWHERKVVSTISALLRRTRC